MEKLFKHPKLIIGIIALITVFFALQLPRAQMDNNNFRFLPRNNKASVNMRYIEATFGYSTIVLVGLEKTYGTIYEAEFLSRLRDYIWQVENIEFVKDINSIITTDYIYGEGDSIVSKPLVDDDFSGTPEEIAELKRRVASWDIFPGLLVSEDQTSVQVLVSFNVPMDDSNQPEVVASFIKVRDLAREMFKGMAMVYVAGNPVVSATINESVITDLVVLIPLVILVLLGALFFSFRRFSFVLLPLLAVLAAVIWTIGAMPLFGVRLSILSSLLPVLLMAVGSAYGIHFITHYKDDAQNRTLTPEEHRALVFELMRKIIKPVFLAALTTFVGFSSFCFTTVLPIREFGIFASFGVFSSFAVAVTLIPSLLLVRGPRQPKTGNGSAAINSNSGSNDPLSDAMADGFLAVARKKRFVMFCTILLIAAASMGMSRLVVDNVLVEYFKHDTDVNKSDRFIREKFGGSKELTLVVEADSAEDLLNPTVLGAVDGLNRHLTERLPIIGSATGFTDFVKRMNQVFNADESPSGLRAAVRSDGGTGDRNFGFGNDDEFGGFGDLGGFGDFAFDDTVEESSLESATADSSGSDTIHSSLIEQYSAANLIALLDSAAGSRSNMSGNELVTELKRQINYDGQAYYEIPVDLKRYGKTEAGELQQLVSNYLLMLSGDISQYANDGLEPTAIKSTIQLRTNSQDEDNRVVALINDYAAANFPKTVRYFIGGGAMTEGAVTSLVVTSQIISVTVAVLMVFIIMALSNRSIAAGLISSVPLALTILCNFALMGFLGIKLNIATSLVASLGVGIGVDYTIHYIESYKREYRASGGKGDFLRRTFTSSGKAILINALSVGLSFGVLAFSRFKVMSEMGLLVAASMFINALVSLTVIPVLLTLINPKFVRQQKA